MHPHALLVVRMWVGGVVGNEDNNEIPFIVPRVYYELCFIYRYRL